MVVQILKQFKVGSHFKWFSADNSVSSWKSLGNFTSIITNTIIYAIHTSKCVATYINVKRFATEVNLIL